MEMLGTCFLHHKVDSDISLWARFGLGTSTVRIFSCCAKIGGIIYMHPILQSQPCIEWLSMSVSHPKQEPDE